MKKSKRFLSLLLAVIMVVSMMLSGVSATTSSGGTGTTAAPKVLWEAGLDIGTGDYDFTANDVSGEATIQGTQMRWNCASPNTSSISVYANQGTTYVTAGVASDIGDGGQCVKIESDGTSRGRANLMVTVPSSVTGQMTYGKEYVLSAWVYRSGSATTDATAQLRANGQNENTVADSIQIVQPAEILPASSTTTGWYKMEVPFKYMGKTLKFEVGIYNGPTTGGYLLIDNLQLAQKGISVDAAASVEAGEDVSLNVVAYPTPAEISYTSSDTSVATVDSTGKVTGVSAGTATITVKAKLPYWYDGANPTLNANNKYVTTGSGVKADQETEVTCVVTVTDGAAQVEPNVIFAESFETWADANTVITSVYSEKADVSSTGSAITSWNGATSAAGWSQYVGTGRALVQPVLGGAQDGNVSMKLTPEAGTGGRVVLVYTLPADVLSQLETGTQYTIRFWCKSEGASFKAIMEPVMHTGWTAQNFDMVDGQWRLMEYTFTADGFSNNVRMSFGIPYGNNKAGAMYLDNISLTKVTQIPATGITIDETATVEMRDDITLTATLTPADATTAVTWTSSDETIATVDANGKVTGVKNGTAIITATAGTVSDTCTVTVTIPRPEFGVVFEESFETFADENTVITEEYSTKDGTVSWNGADRGDWTHYMSSGSVLLQPALGNAKDGNVSIKMTPATTSGRMQIIYRLPNDLYAELEDGGRYKVTAWYKSENANFKAQLEAKYAKGYEVVPFELTNGEWIKGEYSFTLDKSSADSYGRLELTFGIGNPAGSKGSMYIDNITLERIPWVNEIVLDKSETYMEVGETLELNYELKPLGEESVVNFNSSDPSIAEVDADGKITAKKAGTAEIIATAVSGNVAAKCIVHVVEEYVPLESISLNKTTLNVNPGWQEKLTVSFNPANATENDVAWTSSDESVVKVDENGNILTLKVGTATITATATASGKTASCTVTVAEDSSFVSTSKDIAVDFGMNETLDLSQILDGQYTVIGAPARGKVELSGKSLKYTAFTWLMAQDGLGFTDAVYTDTVKIAVQSGEKAAIITLNITINKLEDLFYDENGDWITDVDLMFSAEQIEAIKQEIRENPNGLRAELFAYMLARADKDLNSTPTPYTPFVAGATTKCDEELRSVANLTVNLLMAYLLTEDLPGYEAKNEAYLQKTIEYVKASLSYPYWGAMPLSHRNSDLTAGHHLFSVAMAYYWLKDELQDVTCTHSMGTDGTADTIVTDENMPILEAMEERLWFVCGEMYDHSLSYNVYVMNHCHVRMGGLMAASIALRADADTAERQQKLINYTGMVMYKDGMGMNSLMPDGTSQEGVPYWEYAAEWLIKAGTMIRLTYGIDLFETTHVFENSGDYVLYNSLPQNNWLSGAGSVLNVGDSPTSHWGSPSTLLRFIAGEYGDATAQWLAGVVEASGIDVEYSQWISVMYADTSLVPEEPQLDETLKWFKDMDHVIARSDWSGNEDLLSIKCGVPCGLNLMQLVQRGLYPGEADAGHAHPDANHITLYANGEFLLRDDGYRRKYAANHNTLLVNGEGQLGEGEDWMQERPYIEQDAIPFIKIADSSAAYDYIVGNATEAYESTLGLELFERNILWLKEEQVLLVVDNVKTLTETDLELHWFPQSKSVGISGDVYMLKTNKNVMNFYPMTDETTTAFEDILQYTATGTTTTANEKGFRQTYTGTNWQNAVAFSWDDADGEAAFVAYAKGENANEHQFGVNGKIYTINVATNKITVAEGDLEVEGDNSASDSTVSTVMMNGVVFDEFDPSVTEYEIDRWWKTSELKLEAYTNGYGATVEFEYNNKAPGTITMTCISKDGSSKTVYTFKVTNSEKILGIAGVDTDRPREGFDIGWTYDSVITPTNTGNIWANTGLPTVIYDLGKVVNLEDVIIAFNISARRDSYYDLAYSVDGETWIYLKEDATLKQTDGALNGWHDPVKVVDDANVNARYIKVKLRAHSQSGKDIETAYCSIQEITFTGSEYIAVNVTGGTIADGKDFYEVGDEITVTAQVPEGKKFVRWEVEGVDVDDLTAATITFTLGEDDVKLVAIFEDVIVDDGGDDGDDDKDDDKDDGDGKDDSSSDTGDKALLLPALLLAVMALVACAVLTVGKKYRR